MSKLLVESSVFTFSNELAAIIGEKLAIFMQQIHYNCEFNKENNKKYFFREGKWWVRKSSKDWQEFLKIWSIPTIDRIINYLKEMELIEIEQFDLHLGMAHRWYAIDHENLKRLLDTRDNFAKLSIVARIKAVIERIQNWRPLDQNDEPLLSERSEDSIALIETCHQNDRTIIEEDISKEILKISRADYQKQNFCEANSRVPQSEKKFSPQPENLEQNIFPDPQHEGFLTWKAEQLEAYYNKKNTPKSRETLVIIAKNIWKKDSEKLYADWQEFQALTPITTITEADIMAARERDLELSSVIPVAESPIKKSKKKRKKKKFSFAELSTQKQPRLPKITMNNSIPSDKALRHYNAAIINTNEQIERLEKGKRRISDEEAQKLWEDTFTRMIMFFCINEQAFSSKEREWALTLVRESCQEALIKHFASDRTPILNELAYSRQIKEIQFA